MHFLLALWKSQPKLKCIDESWYWKKYSDLNYSQWAYWPEFLKHVSVYVKGLNKLIFISAKNSKAPSSFIKSCWVLSTYKDLVVCKLRLIHLLLKILVTILNYNWLAITGSPLLIQPSFSDILQNMILIKPVFPFWLLYLDWILWG